MGGTQCELDEVNSESSPDQASQTIKTRKSHQEEEKSPDKLAGGGCNVSFGRGRETPTKRLRDQSFSMRRHRDWVAGRKRYELNCCAGGSDAKDEMGRSRHSDGC